MPADRSLFRELNRMFIGMLPKRETVKDMAPDIYGEISANNAKIVEKHAVRAANAFRNYISVLRSTGDSRVLEPQMTNGELDTLEATFVSAYTRAIVRKFLEVNKAEFDRL